jgi:ribosome-binding protein aMBF1 (putative translation factor)
MELKSHPFVKNSKNAASVSPSPRRRGAMLGIAERNVSVKYEQIKERFNSHNQLPLSMKTLGDWIKTKRIEKKLTPGHLAAKMGIAPSLVCSWEEGIAMPHTLHIAKMEVIFGMKGSTCPRKPFDFDPKA